MARARATCRDGVRMSTSDEVEPWRRDAFPWSVDSDQTPSDDSISDQSTVAAGEDVFAGPFHFGLGLQSDSDTDGYWTDLSLSYTARHELSPTTVVRDAPEGLRLSQVEDEEPVPVQTVDLGALAPGFGRVSAPLKPNLLQGVVLEPNSRTIALTPDTGGSPFGTTLAAVAPKLKRSHSHSPLASSAPQPSMSKSPPPPPMHPPTLPHPPHPQPAHQTGPDSDRCPFCNAVAAVESVQATDPAAVRGCFARYRPRPVARKDNRLGSWYRKYGYAGPRYCKACSEKFNSHMLRQNAQAARAVCSRADPCPSCSSILSNFSKAPEELFAAFDSRRKRRGGSSISTENADALPSKRHRASAKTAAKLGALVALVGLFWGLQSRLIGPATPTRAHQLDTDGWKCGDEMTSLIAGTDDEMLMMAACLGAEPGKQFSCSVNDCATKGSVPIGERTCRCDRCFRPGRCGRWKLQGHSTAAHEGGRECSAPPSFEHPADNFKWRLPFKLSCDKCKACASVEHATPTCGESPYPNSMPCDLETYAAWPRAMAQVPDYTSYPDPVQEGVLWAATDGNGSAALWLYFLNGATGDPIWDWLHATSDRIEARRVDAHMMWKFDPEGSVWWPQTSLIGRDIPHPSAQEGAATWADSSGSLFMLAGRSPYLPELWMYDLGENVHPLMWRYDTTEETWEIVGPHGPHLLSQPQPTKASASPAGVPHSSKKALSSMTAHPIWPAARSHATTWVQAASNQSKDVQLAWMFGGRRYDTGQQQASSELWRYQYHYSARESELSNPDMEGLTSTSVVGDWQLMSVESWESRASVDPPTLQAGVSCTDARMSPVQNPDGPGVFSPDPTRQCPEGRFDAGSWPSQGGRAGGWIFGGTVITPARRLPHGGGIVVATQGQLRDLWQVSVADSGKAVWRQALPGSYGPPSDPIWPPAWSRPAGWLEEEEEDNTSALFISGASGQQYDIVPDCGLDGDCDTFTRGVLSADGSKRHADLWRFDLGSESWQHIEPPGQPGQPAFRSSWPSERQLAVLSYGALPMKTSVGETQMPVDGFMFGGTGASECLDTGDVDFSVTGLTGLWRWETSVDEAIAK